MRFFTYIVSSNTNTLEIVANYIIIKFDVFKQGRKEKLDINNLDEFERLSKFKSGYSLEEIDNFTSKYNDEVSLKSYLYDNSIIDFGDITKELSIRQVSNDKLEK